MASPIYKKELRIFWKKQCATFINPHRSALCCKNLLSLIASFPKILSFSPLPLEIDITELNKKLALEKRLYLPRISGNSLEIYPVNHLSELRQGPFSLKEPSGLYSTPLTEMDLVLLPALAFDRNCYRLGYGKGFYDRLLAGSNIPTLGVGFREQLIEQLPKEKHDIALDALALF